MWTWIFNVLSAEHSVYQLADYEVQATPGEFQHWMEGGVQTSRGKTVSETRVSNLVWTTHIEFQHWKEGRVQTSRGNFFFFL